MKIRFHHIVDAIRILLLLPIAVMGSVCPIAAQVVGSSLGGSVLLDWASYHHEDGADDVEGSHFFQQYSLLYKTEGVINSGRAGRWDIALGYEWNDLSSDLDDEDYDERTDKILYRGDLLFAPGGLPLRIHAYSHDLQQSVAYDHTRGDFGALIDPGIITTINNGQHLTSGLTLLAGIRNGSYLGQYRELLSQFPKLLVDFREDLVRDTERPDPVHYRMRDLAFVSLNKKDNWFHYRHREFEDYENSGSDYTEKTFLLGTVDHLYRRQWINLTNWVKVSTDLSLTQYEEPFMAWEKEETYAFNLFSKARRRNLDVSNFASFRRTKQNDEIENEIYFPVFASGTLDHQSTWRAMLIGSREKNDYFASGVTDLSDETLYGRFQLETTRYPGYVFTPEIALETSSTTKAEGNAAQVGFELSSDDRYRTSYDWLVGYKLTWVNGDRQTWDDGDNLADENVNYWGHELLASVKHRATPGVEVGAIQRLLFGSGDNNGSGAATSYITQRDFLLISQDGNSADKSEDENSFGSYSTAYLELIGDRRMTNRFEGSFIYEKDSSDSEHLLELRHTLRSNLSKSTLRMDNVFRSGEDIRSALDADEVPDPWGRLRNVDMTFSHSTELRYRPNRAWEARGEAGIDWMSGDNDDAWVFSVEEESRYSHYQYGGLSRKILEAYQLFDYEQTWGAASTWYARLECGVDWSPVRRFLVGGNVSLEYWDWREQTEVGYELYAAVDFQKLRAKTSYEYRQRDHDDDESTPTVKDSRLTVSVQKLF
jgi:hypothetical protein